MKKYRGLFAVLLAVLLLLTGCQTDAGADKTPLKAVMQGNAEFYSVEDEKSLKLEQLTLDDGAPIRVQQFALLDLDGDGTQEVVLSLGVEKEEYYGFEVLRYQGEKVYGYRINYRALAQLKNDGTFMASEGAMLNTPSKLNFTDSGYAFQDLTIDLDVQEKKPDAVWYDFTDVKIAEVLG